MKRADVDIFEKLTAQLGSLYQEISTLAKKSPNNAINTFIVNFVNGTLSQCNKLLGQRYRPFSEFDVFSSEDIPSNSDVTFILSQYISCAGQLRADNIYQDDPDWYWYIDDAGTDDKEERIQTSLPKKLAHK